MADKDEFVLNRLVVPNAAGALAPGALAPGALAPDALAPDALAPDAPAPDALANVSGVSELAVGTV